MRRMSKEGRRKMPEATQDLLERAREAGDLLVRQGNRIGHYFLKMGPGSIATQRDTKDQLPRRLKASAEEPMIVTVQPRAGEEGGAYVIVPLEMMVEALEAQGGRKPFVPITARLREIGGNLEIPAIVPRGSGRRKRSASPSMSAGDAALAVDG